MSHRFYYKSPFQTRFLFFFHVLDPFEDQFTRKQEEKKERIAKNKKNQLRNEESALAAEKGLSALALRQKKREEIERTVNVVRKSTASLGRFDKKLVNDGVVKQKGMKRKVHSLLLLLSVFWLFCETVKLYQWYE